MNHQKFNSLLFFAAGFLIIAQPTAGAQEPMTRVAVTDSTDAADRQFLNNLEQADAAKATAPQPIPAAATSQAQAVKKEPPAKALAAVTKKTGPVIRRATRVEAPKTPVLAVSKNEPVVTVTTTTTTLAAVPVEDRRPDDNGFFHRLFHHRNQDIQ